MRTMKDMAQDALSVQDASNLTGVIHSWSRMLPDLRAAIEAHCKENNLVFSTDRVNQHPVNVLFASKVASLTSCEVGLAFGDAYKWANDQVK